MSKSQAQKLRQRHLREGKPDPATYRLNWNGVNPVSKKTPSLKELQAKQQNKHKSRNSNHWHGDDSFFHAAI
ncbi:hypothetical protein [Paenibacillus planticolens]|uniref:Uncharacterized protein n=1 Tax=Paenibacillus planticolens TaxID=2654976 RepID=A0ABX1ZGU6_9BACL|nr:hypothetical protein [Paenibacillus planticolens]NOU99306.1 hypothetical protein [Paenibacillus planticolens]